VVAAAEAQAPGEVTSITWPTDNAPQWAVTVKPERGKPVFVSVDDASGAARLDAKAQQGQGGLARTMRKVHDGTNMGAVWQVIIFLGGLLPAVLAITGVIMWWRARGWRAGLEARRETRTALAE
jgi:uncharacterized iron-regulated membrane protein